MLGDQIAVHINELSAASLVPEPRPAKIAIQCIFIACVLGLLRPGAQAQSSQDQSWPEVDLYAELTSRLRVSYQVKRSTDGNNYDQVQLGPMLSLTLKSILRPRLRSNDISKDRYVTFGVGYQYLTGTSGSPENRGVLQLTPRFPLPLSILLSDRNRIDLRVISGSFSWRYRNRLTLERSFKIKSVAFTPYVRGEVFYNSKYQTWDKNSYAVGVTVPVGKHAELQPYTQHDNSTHASPQHVNALGFITSFYF